MEDNKVSGAIPASSGTQPTAKPSSTPTSNTPKAATPAGTPRQTTTQQRPTAGQPNVRPAANPTPVKNGGQQTLRQKVLNTIIQRRVGETKQSIYKQLGIQNEQELTALLEKVKGYEDLNSKFYNINTELSTLKAEKVAAASGVRPDKLDDLLTYLKGKGLEYTAENIQQAAQGHPEWLANQAQEVVRPATIGKVGQSNQPVVSDIQQARNLFPSLRPKK